MEHRSPSRRAHALRRAIHAIPCNKLLLFGGDSFRPTTSVGYAAQCRRWLLHALEAEARDGLLSEPDAIALARRFMRTNHHELYDLKRVRATLCAVAPTHGSREPGTHGVPADFAAGEAAALDFPAAAGSDQ